MDANVDDVAAAVAVVVVEAVRPFELEDTFRVQAASGRGRAASPRSDA